jgi:hypothetical protein
MCLIPAISELSWSAEEDLGLFARCCAGVNLQFRRLTLYYETHWPQSGCPYNWSEKMKKVMTLLAASVVVLSACTAAHADNKVQDGAKKVGSAIVWPFKKMGQGLKAMGNGMKHMVGKS